MDAPEKRTLALYLLSVARNFEPRHLDLLVAGLGSLDALMDAPESELRRLDFEGSRLERLLAARQGCDPAGALEHLNARGIAFVGWGDECYPELLSRVTDAPVGLYCLGDVSLMRHHGMAIVGSRKCSERGKEHAAHFGRDLAELAVPVVSGMALGIDGAAHEGALAAPGPTVAVLGCGVDVIYPPQHRSLYEELKAKALVLSEYPPGTPPLGEHFPQRNRIISGLSRGVLVVEAALGSGALITAKLALEQGREVFALPGPLKSPYSTGTHHLIKTGQAKLIENVDDILVEFGTNRAVLHSERFAQGGGAAQGGSAQGAIPFQPGLSPEEAALLEAVSYEGTHINALVKKLGITTPACIAHLTMLEIKGLITSASGGYYLRV